MKYSRVCTANDCRSDRFREIAIILKEDPDRMHRKIWEFYAIVDILHDLNMLSEGSLGLGFAVGQEPLGAYFASTGCIITASDLVDQNSVWKDSGQVALEKSHLNLRNICSGSVFEKNVTFKNIDMNNISDNEKQGQYDFIWSSCAMEHLGSIENGINFVKNSLACLKPGGYAIHTTEFNCQSDEDTLEEAASVIFRKRDLLQLQEDIRPEHHFYDMDFNTGSDPLDYTVDKAPYKADVHIKLLLGNFITTSCIFTIQKKS